ncbi:hypothetical protein E2C01_089617 [Portunus trituberculatus]|uniref:Uncharacterized protein n=1 Tax=Portunus trituberculatus TaxID=210409 RepID=A0A5B7JJI7_PORTR|nr:hypothetical protein [Portunus trituberculatus]
MHRVSRCCQHRGQETTTCDNLDIINYTRFRKVYSEWDQ